MVTTPLCEESRMAPRGHPLAGRALVIAEELADQEAAPCGFETAEWNSYRILGSDVPPVESYEDKLELAASDRGVCCRVG
ncbi:hypothetical protein [Streptomyces canus]|uniref:hypothetical protein n=1 Tax=Streptomyces canus TaxID=58343 RepID=UPI0036E4F2EB